MKNVLKVIGVLLALGMLMRLLGGRRRWAARRGLGYGPFGQAGPVPVDGLGANPLAGARREVPVA